MNRFFATFIPGCGEIIRQMLQERLKDVTVSALLDGAVEFETAVPYSDLNLFCFNNVFSVLHRGQGDLDSYLRGIAQAEIRWEDARKNPAKVKTFRLVASKENRLTAMKGAQSPLERQIAKMTGLRLDKSRPDTEFWLLSRSEGACYFLKRLSRHKAYDKLLHPGELHPELAYMLCWLSAPKHTDAVLDPFCGYGAIPQQRAKRFPFERIYAFDKDEKALKLAGENLSRKNPKIILARQDVLSLEDRLGEASIDAVITDPPWGMFEELGGIEGFYRSALTKIDRVLKPGGRLVLLTARKEEFLGAAGAFPALHLSAQYAILVSGKKAGIFVFEKTRCI